MHHGKGLCQPLSGEVRECGYRCLRPFRLFATSPTSHLGSNLPPLFAEVTQMKFYLLQRGGAGRTSDLVPNREHHMTLPTPAEHRETFAEDAGTERGRLSTPLRGKLRGCKPSVSGSQFASKRREPTENGGHRGKRS